MQRTEGLRKDRRHVYSQIDAGQKHVCPSTSVPLSITGVCLACAAGPLLSANTMVL